MGLSEPSQKRGKPWENASGYLARKSAPAAKKRKKKGKKGGTQSRNIKQKQKVGKEGGLKKCFDQWVGSFHGRGRGKGNRKKIKRKGNKRGLTGSKPGRRKLNVVKYVGNRKMTSSSGGKEGGSIIRGW